MRLPRVAILVSTLVAWIVPSGLAMWLDVERFVHPYLAAPAPGDYERDPSFQRLFFVIRFGWLLEPRPSVDSAPAQLGLLDAIKIKIWMAIRLLKRLRPPGKYGLTRGNRP